MIEQVNERWSVWCEHADGRHYRMGDASETRWSQVTAERVAKHMTEHETGTFVAQPCPPPTVETSENAKPCPFCGSIDLDPGGGEEDTEHWVECAECGAQGPYATLGCRDPDEEDVDLDAEALELWNKRGAVGAELK